MNEERQTCPDGGACHHACGDDGCFRVRFAIPLSGVYPDGRWPDSVRAAHGLPPVPLTGEEWIKKIATQLPAALTREYNNDTRCSVYLTYGEWKQLQEWLGHDCYDA